MDMFGDLIPSDTGQSPPDAKVFLHSKLVQGKPDSYIQDLNDDFSGRMQNMFSAAPPEVQKALMIQSGARSLEKQAQLYQADIENHGGHPSGMVAPPGHSQHNHGNAIDLSYNGEGIPNTPEGKAALQWAHQNAANYGLNFPLGNEPWHIEPIEARGERTQVAQASPQTTPVTGAPATSATQSQQPSGMFDDLIPSNASQKSSGMFDDLIPAQQGQSVIKDSQGRVMESPALRNPITEVIPGIIKGLYETGKADLKEIDNYLHSPYGTVDPPIGAAFDAATVFSPTTPAIGLARGGLAAAKTAMPAVGEKALPTEGQQVAEAAARQNIPISRAVTSDSPSTQQFAQSLAGIPAVGTPLKEGAQETIGAISDAVNKARAGYGSSNAEGAGRGIREGITENLQSGPIKRAVEEGYNNVNKLVDQNVTGLLNNTKELARTIDARRANAGIMGKSATDELQNAIDKTNPSKDPLTGKFMAPQGINFEGIKDLRSHFGEMIDGAKPIPDGMSSGEIKQIYGALTQDLKSTIARAGGQYALNAFNKANTAAANWSNIRQSLYNVLKVKSDEGIFSKIVSAASSKSTADIILLGRIRSAVGSQKWDEVASAVIERLGKAPDGTFSPDRLIGPSGLGGLSAEGKKMIFRSTGKSTHADAIDDIAIISRRMSQINKLGNPSGTVKNFAPAMIVTGLSPVLVGNFSTPIATVGSLVGGRILASILASPVSARSMAAWSRTYETAATKATKVGLESFRQASRIFATNIARQFGKPDLADSIAQKLQGSVPAAAQDENQ